MWNKNEFSGGKGCRKSGDVNQKTSKTIAGLTARSLFALAVLGISATLTGCAPTGSTPVATTTPAQAQMNNSALEEKIKTNLNSDEQLKGSDLAVMANADQNEATLSGKVQSESVKTKAVESAKSAQAGLSVSSKIEVDSSCCGGGMHGGPGMHGKEGMPGMKKMPEGAHMPPKN